MRECSSEANRAPKSPAAVPIVGPVLRACGFFASFQSFCARALDHARQLPWAREVAALRIVVSELRAELDIAYQREKAADHLAYHDDLTDLPNRRHFINRLTAALEDCWTGTNEVAIVCLDLDGFKALNDRYGSDTGDELLKIVAARLTRAVPAQVLVCRLGGDKFACLLRNSPDRDRVNLVASIVSAALASPFQVGHLTLTVQSSVGTAVFPVDGMTVDQLLRSADAAMHAAKRLRTATSLARRPRLVAPAKVVRLRSVPRTDSASNTPE